MKRSILFPPVQRRYVGVQPGGGGGGPEFDLDQPEPGQDRCQDFEEEEGDNNSYKRAGPCCIEAKTYT